MIESISAVTLATHDMACAIVFYPRWLSHAVEAAVFDAIAQVQRSKGELHPSRVLEGRAILHLFILSHAGSQT